MFITFSFRSFVDDLLRRQDKSTDLTVRFIQEYTDKVIVAKEAECQFYRSRIDELCKERDLHRLRAEAAIDRLLMRDAKVAPLEQMDSPESKAEEMRISEVLKSVFDQTNSIGDDVGNEDINSVVMVNGVKVE